MEKLHVRCMDMRALVGRNFLRLRKQKGLTQEGVAALSGYTQQYVSELERGLSNPTIITIYELAQAIGVNYMDIVRPDEESP